MKGPYAGVYDLDSHTKALFNPKSTTLLLSLTMKMLILSSNSTACQALDQSDDEQREWL